MIEANVVLRLGSALTIIAIVGKSEVLRRSCGYDHPDLFRERRHDNMLLPMLDCSLFRMCDARSHQNLRVTYCLRKNNNRNKVEITVLSELNYRDDPLVGVRY